MTDPRAANCQAYHIDSGGRVDGVKLVYVEHPAAKYQLLLVELIPERDAGGDTVATCVVQDKNGVQLGASVYLAWPFPAYTNKLLPGNPNGQHMISNGYDGAGGQIGPLALWVGDATGSMISDEIGGLGLPNNRHVCYRVTFRERGSSDTGGGGGGSADMTETNRRLDEMIAILRKLGAHLGA